MFNLGKTKEMVNGGVTMDAMSKSKVANVESTA